MESIINVKAIDLEKNFSLFKGVSQEAVKEIKKSIIHKYYPVNMVITAKNEPIQFIYLILQGTIHIIKEDSEGKEQIASILRSGEFFPHIGLFENALTPGTAYTTEETNLLLIPIRNFRTISLENPTILMEYSKAISRKLAEIQKRLEEKAFYSTYQQIVFRILFLAEKYGKKSTENDLTMLNISLTHEELAKLVGTTRETVSRSITKLKKKDAIKIIQGNLFINLDKLKEEINGCLNISKN